MKLHTTDSRPDFFASLSGPRHEVEHETTEDEHYRGDNEEHAESDELY